MALLQRGNDGKSALLWEEESVWVGELQNPGFVARRFCNFKFQIGWHVHRYWLARGFICRYDRALSIL